MNTSFLNKILFLFLLPLMLLGQNQKNDLTKLPYEQLKKLFFDNQKSPSQQFQYASAFLNKAKNEKDNRQIARGYYWFSLMNKEDKAISYLDSVIKYSTGSKDLNFPIAAYCEKGSILSKQSKHQEALDVFLLAEKYALKNNRTDDYYAIQFHIAVTRSENLGEIDEALDKYKACYHYFKSKNTKIPPYSYSYQKVIFAIADAYKTLHQTDSATYYNKLGYKEAKINGDQDFLYLFVLNEGANLVIKKKYNLALDSINKALPEMIKFNDKPNTMAAYYYLGKVYEGMKNEAMSVKNYLKVDSIYKVTKTMYPELTSTYPFLISYYKNKGDKDKQLEYINKYMKIDDSLQKSHNKMYKLLVKKYDFPHLVKDKEELIQSLKNDVPIYYWAIGIVLFIATGLGVYGVYQRNLKQTYKIRFEKIITNTVTNIDKPIVIDSELIIDNDKNRVKDIGIADSIIKQILERLHLFEIQKLYLKSNVTVKTLSEQFETNDKYLSKIVNLYKNKRFNDYINDLRIDEVVTRLQQDKDLKKHRIESLAIDFGFNNAESFSIAFDKRTGLKPSYFIKELINK
jgi:AraC-like DNA-binding protein